MTTTGKMTARMKETAKRKVSERMKVTATAENEGDCYDNKKIKIKINGCRPESR